MTDERQREDGLVDEVREEGATPVETATAKPRRRRWVPILIGAIVVLPALLTVIWTAIALSYSYSKGDRAGYIQKFSQKGWICKTWEGELAQVNVPGAMQERFLFSVRSDSIAQELSKLMGSRVSITYEEHRGVPGTCFGETDYFVTQVKQLP